MITEKEYEEMQAHMQRIDKICQSIDWSEHNNFEEFLDDINAVCYDIKNVDKDESEELFEKYNIKNWKELEELTKDNFEDVKAFYNCNYIEDEETEEDVKEIVEKVIKELKENTNYTINNIKKLKE